MSAMTWSKLRTFLAVADLGSVRAAATQLHVSEPAVSTAVGHLARHLGVDLLVASGRGIRLSAAGEVYADYCRRVLGLLEEAESAVRRADTGRLRIGAVATASESVLPRLLATFRARFPGVDISVSVEPRDDLFAALALHQSDLVIAGRPPRASGLVTRATRANSLILVGRHGVDQPPETATWLLRGPGSGTRETCLSFLSQHQWDPPLLTLGTQGACVAGAREGLGVTLVHADAIPRDPGSVGLAVVPVRGLPLDRPWHVVTNPGPVPAARLFVEHLCDPEQSAGERFRQQRPRP